METKQSIYVKKPFLEMPNGSIVRKKLQCSQRLGAGQALHESCYAAVGPYDHESRLVVDRDCRFLGEFPGALDEQHGCLVVVD